MLIAIAALLAVTAFLVLFRLLWLNVRPIRATTLITLVAAVLIVSLGFLAATGRLSWVAALGAAVLPFLRRGIGLIRYLPWARHLFGLFRQRSSNRQQSQHSGARSGSEQMTRQRALEILGLEGNPGRDEIVAAHRRLMQRLHPDRGGSTFLAQQLNEAKKILLDSS